MSRALKAFPSGLRSLLLVAVAGLAMSAPLIAAGPASAAVAVVNGGFETGTLEGWSLFQSGEGIRWAALDRAGSEAASIPFPPPVGNWAAYAEETEQGTTILSQNVTLEPATTDRLSLYFGYLSDAAMTVPADGSLETTPTVNNQQVRIDVMKPTAPLESVSPADILATVFATGNGSPEELAPRLLSADLSPFAGQTVRLRVAVATNVQALAAVLDGVSIVSEPIPPPLVTPPGGSSSASSPPPSNAFTSGKLTLDKKKGTAMLAVNVPGAGTLIGADARRKVAVASRRARPNARPLFVRTATVSSGAAGTVELPIKPTPTALRLLKAKGTLPIRLTMTFTPVGGSAATQPYAAKLVRKLRPAPAPARR
jgi:hypothetical protein